VGWARQHAGEQAGIPLLSAFEMATAARDVLAKASGRCIREVVSAGFGDDVFSNTATAFKDASAALQAFQLEDSSFHPYSSKFDLYAGTKSAARSRRPKRGGWRCSAIRRSALLLVPLSGRGTQRSSALFTDFSYEAIGVPRSAGIRANADSSYVDMALRPAAQRSQSRLAGGA